MKKEDLGWRALLTAEKTQEGEILAYADVKMRTVGVEVYTDGPCITSSRSLSEAAQRDFSKG